MNNELFKKMDESISISLENSIISSIKSNIFPPKCYEKFDEEKYKNYNLTIVQSIYNIVVKNFIYDKATNFNSQLELIQEYNSGVNILNLSKKYSLPPLYLLNIILKKKYNHDIKYINKNKQILNERDYQSFILCKKKDIYTLEQKIDKNNLISKEYVKQYLYKNNIKFIENEYWFDLVDKINQYKWILYTNDYGSCLKKKYNDNFDYNYNQIQSIYPNSNGIIFYLNNFCSKLQDSSSNLLFYLNIENQKIPNIINIDIGKQGDFYKFGIESKTDKVTHHNYYKYYPIFLESYRKIIKSNKKNYGMLEIGINHYRSLKLWMKYFPESYIYGIDIGFEDEGKNYNIFKCDQSNLSQLISVSNKILLDNREIFFIIDDGSHHPLHQISTFNLFFDKLLSYGGCYIIEDIETSYWSKNNIYGYKTDFGYKNTNSAIEITKNFIDDINGEFLTNENKQNHNNKIKSIVSDSTRNLISGIFYGQNNIIIMKKTLDDLDMNYREYRYKDNL